MGAYDVLAAEYYEAKRHPTCANFREASELLFRAWLPQDALASWSLCEVGPGKSILAEFCARTQRSLQNLVLVDDSELMLLHSTTASELGARLLVGDARRLPIRSGSVDFLASVLGDSYNVADFWAEVRRVLKPGGGALYTTPSWDWAVAFRDHEIPEPLLQSAKFETKDGGCAVVPSLIMPIEQQCMMIQEAGLLVKETFDAPIAALTGELSPKLVVARGPNASVVTGFRIARPVA